ncbi:hypothetical protein N7470_006860 [Penicillium chermesinum]|nr:hypothetical protein N7470_006860 [Penicillium chermesinum]
MPGDDPFGFLGAEQLQQASKPVAKPAKKQHWREKLFSKDKKNASADQRQIDDFLASNRPQAVDTHHLAPVSAKVDSDLLPPTISTQQVPSHDFTNASPPRAPQQSQIPSENYTAFNFTDHTSDQPAPRSHPHRPRKGLRVAFSEQEPEVIGEGGDESEIPTAEISLARKGARGRLAAADPSDASRSPDPSKAHLPTLRLDTSLGDNYDEQRGHSQDGAGGISPSWKPPLVANDGHADLLNTLHISKPHSRLSFRASPESNSFAERVRNQMQVEEGRALHNHFDDEESLSDEDQYIDDDANEEDLSPVLPSHNSRSPVESAHDTPISHKSNAPSVKSIAHSLRQPQSPAASRGPNLSPIERGIPAGLLPGSPLNASPTPPHALPVQAPPMPPPAPPPTEKVPSPPRHQAPAPAPAQAPAKSAAPPKFSLRSLATQVGDSSYLEFKNYIGNYDDHLKAAAESVKPLMETSLSEWVRAALWWFLRGKTRLETFARTRSHCPPSYAKQAVIDLGKAFWINENIVPAHSELSRYGQMSVDALLAVASTTGNKDLADLLSLHQNMNNHLRSLSMSIKRNNIIDLILESDDSPSQADTSVWLRYPFFAPDVAAVLSGAASRSMLADKPGKLPSMVYMMPLGDSSVYFSYGSMFVQACVSSREDEGGQQYAMPCCLTIIRERVDWYVCAAITSQSQLVNIMIQADRKQGPTWDDVDWQVHSHSMRVKLPRGFELDVMFKDDDFKTLWNIVKYTQKSEASLAPEPGEKVVFENTVKVFQYMDPGTPKSFPSDPVERCRVRLFERFVTIKEGTGTREAHRGFRLTVLTSPKVKTLSNVKHILGQGTPVVFGLLRGEDGAPAMLLKVTEDGRTRSMLMTFHEVEERTQMHAVLLGMVPREGELKSPEIAFRSFSMEQPGDAATGQPPVTHIQFPPGNVFVIDQENPYGDHGYGPTILSENLRAFIATEWGSVTDRINLGKRVHFSTITTN